MSTSFPYLRSRAVAAIVTAVTAVALLVAVPPPAHAATVTLVVDTTADDPTQDDCDDTDPAVDCSFRAAIGIADADTSGDDYRIELAAADYVLDHPNRTVSIAQHTGGEIRVVGVGSGDGGTEMSTAGGDRMFFLQASRHLILEDVAFTGARNNGYGGVLFANDGTVTVRDARFEDNEAAAGGAIGTYGGVDVLTVTDSVFVGNRGTDGVGGALRLEGTDAVISGSTFRGNTIAGDTASEGWGGAIDAASATVLTSTGNTYESNRASNAGGAISVRTSGSLASTGDTFVTNTADEVDAIGGAIAASGASSLAVASTFAANSADADGGAIHTEDPLTIDASTFDDNVATSNGYGGAVFATGALTVTDSQFTGNRALASNHGGAISVGGAATISGSTFAANLADGGLGGAVHAFGDLSLENSTVTDNQGDAITMSHSTDLTVDSVTFTGDDEVLSVPGTATATVVNAIFDGPCYSFDDSITSAGSNLATTASIADGCGLDHADDLTPADPLLGALADNGGPTSTHALGDGSPAIDTGATVLDHDQRGEGRPAGGGDDVGAYEAQGATNRAPVATDDTASTAAGQPVMIDVLANDTDADGDVLTIVDVTTPNSGSVVFESSEVRYTPDDGFDGDDTFLYTVSDGSGGTASATVTVTVEAADEHTARCPDDLDDAFDDDDGSFHEAYIDCAAWLGIVQGYEDGTFRPRIGVDRAQAATIVHRIVDQLGVDLPADPPDAFGDDDGSVHELAIDRLAAAGLIEGYGDRRVGPGDTLSRGQAATLLDAAFTHVTGQQLPDGDDVFDDDDGSVHEAAIERLAAAGVLDGYGARRFGPMDRVTRGQLARLSMELLRATGA